jgi:hydrogenase small subunit
MAGSKDSFMPDAIEEVHVFWLAGASCDGCSVSTLGATAPAIEDLLNGNIPGVPKVILHSPILSMTSGEDFTHSFNLAEEGKLDAPFVAVYEGSIMNEDIASETGGFWSGMGVKQEHVHSEGVDQPSSTAESLKKMSRYASAVIAIGTCATWGGIPAAAGNPTDAKSLMDFLGDDYLSVLGLPVINVPGCAPQGDNFTETVAVVLQYLNGIGPLPEFDELGRPQWQFSETVHRGCARAGFYEEGTFAEEYGDQECLVEIGCWGPVVQCNINRRGAIGHMGGCMHVGGPCIGCTMPGFPDSFVPFYTKPPGTFLSSNVSRTTGFFITKLRRLTQKFHNRTRHWRKNKHVPQSWGNIDEPSLVQKGIHYSYEKLQFWSGAKPKENEDTGSRPQTKGSYKDKG